MAKRRPVSNKAVKDTIARNVIRGDSEDTRLDILKKRPIGAWPYPRIFLHVLLERSISYADKVIWPWFEMIQQGVPYIKLGYGRTDFSRNQSAIMLLKSNFTHHLMIDADHIHPGDLIERLAKWVILDDNVWVVGGLNFRRGVPYEPCSFVYGEDKKVYSPAAWPNGLMEVDVLGTGCVLIDRRVYETIEPPWYTYDYGEVWRNHWPGEDISFSRRCREAGIKLWTDCTTTSPHCIDQTVDANTFHAYNKQHNIEMKGIDGKPYVERAEE